jgi:hypothetical protein
MSFINDLESGSLDSQVMTALCRNKTFRSIFSRYIARNYVGESEFIPETKKMLRAAYRVVQKMETSSRSSSGN